MIQLWELLVADADPIPESPLDTPHPALARSKMCFETLIRLYYLRHGFEAADVYLTHYLSALFAIAQEILTCPSSTSSTVDEARATLILSAKGLHDQGRSYYLSETMFNVVESRMSSEDAELMRKFVHVKKGVGEARQLHASRWQSQLPVNIVESTGDAEIARLSYLIGQYAISPTLHETCTKHKQ
jgi:hypothetical protein